jgi:glycosyltransferase involved in cell wall biosynthesis
MAGHPVISVLLPVRNGAACVEDAIQSILSQSFAQLELVIVENGSTDGTRATLESCGKSNAESRGKSGHPRLSLPDPNPQPAPLARVNRV